MYGGQYVAAHMLKLQESAKVHVNGATHTIWMKPVTQRVLTYVEVHLHWSDKVWQTTFFT